MNKETLEQVLRGLPFGTLKIDVVPDGRRFTAIVTTPDFAQMDESERQRRVWGHLRKHFTDHELIRLEFIFTNSPDEELAAESAQ